jgi:hypothetical protein
MKRAYLFTAALALAACGSMRSSDDGWTTLIDNGKGLEYFDRVGEANWAETDGAVQATQGSKTPAYLVSKGSYQDFMVRAEFWVSDDANSGVFLRCDQRKEIGDKICYEANIFDQRPDPSYGTGAIVHHAKIENMPKAGGKWNVYEITVKGPRITVVLNGRQTVDIEDRTHTQGPIALQWGRGTVKFRKVQIKRI